MRIRSWLQTFAFVLLLGTAADGQGAASGVLMGQVVDARGAGVAGAMVIIDGALEAIGSSIVAAPLPGGPKRTLTSADGRFVFFDLPKGTYSVEAAKAGFMVGSYGRTRYGGEAQSLQLGEGARPTLIRIPIWEFAVIGGRLLDEAGEPVVGVTVRALPRVLEAGRWRLESAMGATLMDDTDDRGEYRIDGLRPGDYVVAVASSAVTAPRSLVETASRGAARTDGPAGTPAAPSQVGQVRAGDWLLLSAQRSAMTIPSPAPGAPTRVYPTTFYPAARSLADAQVLTLTSGEERLGVDLRPVLATATVVSGTLIGLEPPPPGVSVRLQPAYITGLTTDRGFEAGIATTDANGRFTFIGITPGEYTMRASVAIAASQDADRREFIASLPITVGEAGVEGVTLTLARGVSVSGRVTFDGALPQPGPEIRRRLAIRLDPADPFVHRSAAAFRAVVDTAGNFRVVDVPPGRYVVKFNASAEDRRAMQGWESVGAMLAGRDVSTRPLQVESSDVSGIVLTLSDHAGRLSGTVRDPQGRVDAGACVLLFTTDRELWTDSGSTNRRLRAVRASENGTFVIPVVHAGEYFLAAIPDEDAADWNEPRTMERIARSATRIVFRESERKTQDVTTKAVR